MKKRKKERKKTWKVPPFSLHPQPDKPYSSNEEEQRLSLLFLERVLHVWWLPTSKHNAYIMVDFREREIEIFPFPGFDFRGRGTTSFPLQFFFFIVFFFIRKKKTTKLNGGSN